MWEALVLCMDYLVPGHKVELVPGAGWTHPGLSLLDRILVMERKGVRFGNLWVWSDDVVLGVFGSGPSGLGFLLDGQIERDYIRSLGVPEEPLGMRRSGVPCWTCWYPTTRVRGVMDGTHEVWTSGSASVCGS